MNRRTKIGIILASVFLLVVLAAGHVMASRTVQTDCSVCHTDPTGIAVGDLGVGAGERADDVV